MCYSVSWSQQDAPLVLSQRPMVRCGISIGRREKLQPPEHGQFADLPLFVSAFGEKISLYRDMAGQSLHRRGYRSAMHKASLNESAAAGLLLMAGWKEASHQTGTGVEGILAA